MTLAPQIRRELCDLLGALRDGRLDQAGLARLDAMVTADAAARRFYRNYVDLCVSLHWAAKDREEALTRQEPDNTAFPPIVVDVSPASRESLFSRLFAPGGFVFSYGASAVLLLIAILIGWSLKISRDAPVADHRPTNTVANQQILAAPNVARVTAALDCQWADPREALPRDARISQGRAIALVSGLLEITYDSGAKVILQGPCAYRVSSAHGGFLSLGRLTARVEKEGLGISSPLKKGATAGLSSSASKKSRENTAGQASSGTQTIGIPLLQQAVRDLGLASNSAVSNHSNPQSPTPNPLFTIHTPTAIITDLGTEFGVEVERSGETRSRVYRGHVELRPARGRDRAAASPIILDAGQSARVKPDGKGRAAIVRESWSGSDALMRRMPTVAAIRLFNTGAGLTERQIDPHWQLVGRSDLPAMTPRPVGVTGGGPDDRMFLLNDPARSQWITLDPADQSTDVNVVYTLRTTFKLDGASARSTVLRGRFLVCNEVKAIRLNGVAVAVPKHDPLPPFKSFHPFSVDKGFVEGTNTLEFDVIRTSVVSPRTGQRFVFPVVVFRAELLGLSTRDPKAEPEKEWRK